MDLKGLKDSRWTWIGVAIYVMGNAFHSVGCVEYATLPPGFCNAAGSVLSTVGSALALLGIRRAIR